MRAVSLNRKKRFPKYGTGTPEVDVLALRTVRFLADLTDERPNGRGEGITLFGGECLTYADFVTELSERLYAEGISVDIDTYLRILSIFPKRVHLLRCVFPLP